MASRALQTWLQHLRRGAAVERVARLTDAELLGRFLAARDEAAFEVLVWRHGPTVWRVCRRVAGREADAEDAFQATFLLLARRAGSIRNREALASWLYKVAYRAAREARAPACLPADAGAADGAAGPAEEALAKELQAALHEEVSRLPEKHRGPLVLCGLEGRGSREVAAQLGCPEATVRTRLARARERLRTRLARRGFLVSAGALAAALSPELARAAP